MANEKSKAWDRLKDETEKAYEAFSTYRDLGVGRTFVAVADKLHKSCTLIRRWAKRHNWEERAAAYDSSITEGARKANINSIETAIKRKNSIAGKLEEKALAALKNLNLSRVSGRTIVEMLTLSNTLRNEAVEIENANDADSRVTSIEIKRRGDE